MGRRKKNLLITIVVHGILLFGAFIFFVPIYWMLRSGMIDIQQVFVIPPKIFPDPIMWNNFRDALTTLPFDQYFINTFTVVFIGVTATLITASLSAFSFARLQWRGKNLWFALIMSTMMLPTAAKLVPSFLIWKNLGLLNTYVPLVAVAFMGGTAFDMFLLRQFFLGIPRELDEAAYIDGANYFQIYAHIMLPLSKPALVSLGLFAFLGYWNDFLGPLVYLNDQSKYTLALGLTQFQGMLTSQWQLLMAATAIVVLPVMVVFLLGQKYFVEGIVTTGLKG